MMSPRMTNALLAIGLAARQVRRYSLNSISSICAPFRNRMLVVYPYFSISFHHGAPHDLDVDSIRHLTKYNPKPNTQVDTLTTTAQTGKYGTIDSISKIVSFLRIFDMMPRMTNALLADGFAARQVRRHSLNSISSICAPFRNRMLVVYPYFNISFHHGAPHDLDVDSIRHLTTYNPKPNTQVDTLTTTAQTGKYGTIDSISKIVSFLRIFDMMPRMTNALLAFCLATEQVRRHSLNSISSICAPFRNRMLVVYPYFNISFHHGAPHDLDVDSTRRLTASLSNIQQLNPLAATLDLYGTIDVILQNTLIVNCLRIFNMIPRSINALLVVSLPTSQVRRRSLNIIVITTTHHSVTVRYPLFYHTLTTPVIPLLVLAFSTMRLTLPQSVTGRRSIMATASLSNIQQLNPLAATLDLYGTIDVILQNTLIVNCLRIFNMIPRSINALLAVSFAATQVRRLSLNIIVITTTHHSVTVRYPLFYHTLTTHVIPLLVLAFSTMRLTLPQSVTGRR